MRSPDHTASAGEIARELCVHHVTVNSKFSSMGIKVVERMGLPAEGASRRYPRQWRILALEGAGSTTKKFFWQLRPEVVKALEELGFTGESALEKDERAASSALTEGNLSASYKEIRHRNAIARERCLAYHGLVCKVCKLDFGLTYGPEFRDCIHVHHLNPMAQADSVRAVNPETDLVPVCPNCHAVIHAQGEVRSLEVVRDFLRCNKV